MTGMLPLDELSHAELYLMRLAEGADHGMLAPYEHRAFAREFARESPVRAAISLPFAIPAYTAAKALGLTRARSPASLAEIGAGYHGLAEGLGMLTPKPEFDRMRGMNELSYRFGTHVPGYRSFTIPGMLSDTPGFHTRPVTIRDEGGKMVPAPAHPDEEKGRMNRARPGKYNIKT